MRYRRRRNLKAALFFLGIGLSPPPLVYAVNYIRAEKPVPPTIEWCEKVEHDGKWMRWALGRGEVCVPDYPPARVQRLREVEL